ncbi:MAG: CYTH and CHAD domain-containing protein [Acidimicrobiales bacterium]|nr:CYTH and CHAD domain-containing protein [Acidimicrobiales bacterium]
MTAPRPTRPAPALERETKLAAWVGFALPDLNGVADEVVARPLEPLELDATYWDTTDLRLARSGVTVRHRTGDGEPRWTVKLPAGEGTHTLVRTEHDVAGPAEAPPAPAVGLVRALARTAPLVPVARLRTHRGRVMLVAPSGDVLAEVDDDEVSVLDGERVAARFREVEVELAPGDVDGLAEAVIDRLRAAGAGDPDPTPKLVRSLGPRASAPPDLDEVVLPDAPSAAEVIRAGVTAAVLRVIRHDPVVRLDADIEGVHQARVGTRRLRSDLRTFRPLLDTAWSEPLRDELSWLAGALGAVRDADVLLARLRRDAGALPEPDRPHAATLLRRLERERGSALSDLLVALDSDRYAELLDRLVDGARAPGLLPAAEGPATEVLPPLVRGPWKKLRKAVAGLEPVPTDAELHAVRIAAKRARYAADVIAPVAGDRARAHAKALAAVQDVLGDHNDAAVAEAWLRRAVAAGVSRSQAVAAGELIALQRAEAATLRQAWPGAWAAASSRKLRSWIDRP